MLDGKTLALFVQAHAQVVHHACTAAELAVHVTTTLLQEVQHEHELIAIGLGEVSCIGITHRVSVVEILAPLPPEVCVAAEYVGGFKSVVAHRLVHRGQVVAPTLPHQVDKPRQATVEHGRVALVHLGQPRMVVVIVCFAGYGLRLTRGGVVGVVPLRPVFVEQRARVVEQALRIGVAKKKACVRRLNAAVGVQLDIVEGYAHVLVERVHAEEEHTEHNVEQHIVLHEIIAVGVDEPRTTICGRVAVVLHAIVRHRLVEQLVFAVFGLIPLGQVRVTAHHPVVEAEDDGQLPVGGLDVVGGRFHLPQLVLLVGGRFFRHARIVHRPRAVRSVALAHRAVGQQLVQRHLAVEEVHVLVNLPHLRLGVVFLRETEERCAVLVVYHIIYGEEGGFLGRRGRRLAEADFRQSAQTLAESYFLALHGLRTLERRIEVHVVTRAAQQYLLE